jgi:hypothetical protein
MQDISPVSASAIGHDCAAAPDQIRGNLLRQFRELAYWQAFGQCLPDHPSSSEEDAASKNGYQRSAIQ